MQELKVGLAIIFILPLATCLFSQDLLADFLLLHHLSSDVTLRWSKNARHFKAIMDFSTTYTTSK
jgi:hypothetical protein